MSRTEYSTDPAPFASVAPGLAARGMHVFPVEERGKRPHPILGASGGFKLATTDAGQVAAWATAAPHANIGLVPGPSGLLVLDLDGEDAVPHAAALGSHDGGTLTVQTARGWHRYYQRPAIEHIGNAALAPHLDVRADAGYVLGVGSVHPSGAVYRVLHRRPIAPCPAGVVDALRAKLAPPAPVRSTPRPWRPDDARQGKRLARYLEKVPGGLADGRKQTCYRLACALLHDFGLSVADAAAILDRWNASNAPPLEDRTLTSIGQNAAKYGRHRGAA
ncbi:MAG: bifunctional DNA primase/polymerase [Gemmatimonadota bacterium]